MNVSLGVRISNISSKVYAVFSRHKNGAKKVHRLATLHRMVDEHRLTVGIEVVRREDGTAGTVRRLPWRVRQRGTCISAITVDRGFYSVDIVETVKAHGNALDDARCQDGPHQGRH